MFKKVACFIVKVARQCFDPSVIRVAVIVTIASKNLEKLFENQTTLLKFVFLFFSICSCLTARRSVTQLQVTSKGNIKFGLQFGVYQTNF